MKSYQRTFGDYAARVIGALVFLAASLFFTPLGWMALLIIIALMGN